MTAGSLHDAAARKTATTVFDRNLVVLAGAGTGKTSLLIERLLVAIASGRSGPRDFAAITFTDRAAGEMRERLASGLALLRRFALGAPPAPGEAAGRAFASVVGSGDVPAETVAARALAALADLDRATVATIHGFCSEILHAHAVEAVLDPSFDVDDASRFDALFDERWERWLSAELAAGAPRAALWTRALGRLEAGELEAAARSLARFGVPVDLLERPYAPVDARALFGAEAERWAAGVESVLGAPSLKPAPRAYVVALQNALAALRSGGWVALRGALAGPAAAVLEKDPPALTDGKVPAEVREAYAAVAAGARRFLRALAPVDEEAMADLHEAVAPFAREMRAAALREGHVGFDGLLTLTRDLLRDRPDVRERIRRRYRMLLVDEFQDTDPVQYEIVLFLAEAPGGAARDPYAARLSPGRLFIVGDAKQSIYRFRGADYAAFRRAVDRVVSEGGEALDLVSNFRSVPGILGPVNRLFDGAGSAWVESDTQPRYVAILPASGDAGPSPAVEVWTIEADGDANERRLAEGRALAEAIRRAKDGGAVEHYGGVLVLLRAFTSLGLYLRALREAGIPFVAGGGKTFLDRPEIEQALALLRAVARPVDEVALLAYLRSPAGGVPDTELHAHAASGGRWRADASVDGTRAPRLERALKRLCELVRRTRRLPADAAVREALEASFSYPLAAFAFEGAQRIANLQKLSTTAAGLARDGRLTLNQVLDALDERRGSEIERESPLADEGGEAVRVLTVHAAKGLESPWVFVPDLSRQEAGARASEAGADLLRHDGDGWLALRGKALTSAARVRLELDHQEHERAETLRLLYVATTRAKERLVLLASGTGRGKAPWIKALGAWGYDPDAPPADGAPLAGGTVVHRLVAPAAGRAEAPAVALAVPDTGPWTEAIARVRAAVRSPFEGPSAAAEHGAGSGILSGGRDRSIAQAAGTAVHTLLERWDPLEPGALLRDAEGVAGSAAAENGADPGAVLAEVRAALDAFVRSPLPARLARGRILGREVPMLLRRENGTAWKGSIDLLLEEADRGIVVIDYKTDSDPAGAEARYGPQLAAYVEAVRRALRLAQPPRAELWMVRSGSALPVAT